MSQMSDTASWPQALWHLWAKSSDDEGRWLSIPQHMIDSAEVAALLWNDWLALGVKEWLCGETGLLHDEAGKLVSWLAGIHDVGKIDPAFIGQLDKQRDQSWLVDRARDAGLTFPTQETSDRIPHSHLSEALAKEYLVNNMGLRGRHAGGYAAIAGAHHGLPCSPTDFDAARSHLRWIKRTAPDWLEMQNGAFRALAEHIAAGEVLSCLTRPLSAPAQMVITGLVIVTDWIASNAEACTLSSSGNSDDPDRAARALNSIDPTTPWVPEDFEGKTPEVVFSQRFGWPADRRPRPMQIAALELVRSAPGAGGLLIVEAPMGQGKTEAALTCAEVLAARSGAGGIMFAAPTMVTADGILQRLIQWAKVAMTDPEAVASLFLGHSKAHLNQDFQRLHVREIREEHHGDVIAHQWLSGRKKGILSNAVVGTVDQVLFMALQSKHMMLRHLGLAQKVVVIDEVHAYDTYMSQYLQTALHWLGRYQAPVVLLSATLPHSRKKELLTAYQSGLTGAEDLPELEEAGEDYPVITHASTRGVQTAMAAPGGEPQHVEIHLIADDDEDLREALRHTADHGGCTAVVCSTVDRAQHVYRLAQEMVGDDADLLHARFIASQRVEKENRLLQQLGPASSLSNGSRPTRRIVVATQVIEQSLDVDFDYMITDIAPSDLVLQRIGRLHRHARPETERPEWARRPRVALRGFTRFPTEDEPPEFDDLLTLIYPAKLLLASVAALRLTTTYSAVELPTDIPRVVRETYEDPTIPHSWTELYEKATQDLEKKEDDAVQRAKTYKLKSPIRRLLFDLYEGFADDVDKDASGEQRGLAQVRDTDPSLEVLLVEGNNDTYRPLTETQSDNSATLYRGHEPPREIAQHIAASSIRLPHSFSHPWRFEQAITELEERTDPAWAQSYLLRGQLMLTLDEELKATVAGREIRYDFQLGLTDVTPSEYDHSQDQQRSS